MSHRVVGIVVSVALFHPWTAAAQDPALSEVLIHLIQSEIRLSGPAPGSGFPSHAAHFLPGEDQQLAPFLFNQSIVSQLSTFPIGSSAGGFSYSFDPALGTFTRSTPSFGPSFAERAVTLGRRRASVGASYQHATFHSFEGKRLDTGDIKFYLTHLQETGAFFEGDIVQAALSMRLKTDTFSMFASYGVTDRLDVGVAIPIVHVSLDANVDATILRLATLDSGPTAAIHTFPNGGSTATFSGGGDASGIGDVLLRAKYHLLRRGGGGLAVALDVRPPSGDANDLLGTGATQAKFLLIGSATSGRLSPHVNVGYTASGRSSNALINVTDEFNYALGTEITPSPRVTIGADLLGRQLRDAGRLVEHARVFNWTTQAGVRGSTTFSEFALESGSLNLTFGSVGAKYNPVQNLLISGNVLIPLTDRGIRSRPVPVIGAEYSF